MSTSGVIQAVVAGDTEAVRGLLERDPSLAEATGANGVSALLQAHYRNRPDIVALFLASRKALDLFEAAALGRTERVSALLASGPEAARAYSPDGFTALHLSAYYGHRDAAELLLRAGAPAGAVAKNAMRVQPLHSAVSTRRREIAALLLRHGADPNARQEGGWTPLQGAAHNGDLETVRLLLESGADASLVGENGKTAADLARDAGHDEVARLLGAA